MKLKKWIVPWTFLILSASSLALVLAFLAKWIVIWFISVLPILNFCYSRFFLEGCQKKTAFIVYNGFIVYLPVAFLTIAFALGSNIGEFFLVGCLGFAWCIFWGLLGNPDVSKKTPTWNNS